MKSSASEPGLNGLVRMVGNDAKMLKYGAECSTQFVHENGVFRKRRRWTTCLRKSDFGEHLTHRVILRSIATSCSLLLHL